MSIKQWLRNWLMSDERKVNKIGYPDHPLAISTHGQDHIEQEAAQMLSYIQSV